MRILREKHLTKYGFRPTFSAGYHCGKVIVGEIGDLKSQITFLGHVLYTTASVEKHCRKLEKEILVSETLMKLISLPEIYEMKLAGCLEQKISLIWISTQFPKLKWSMPEYSLLHNSPHTLHNSIIPSFHNSIIPSFSHSLILNVTIPPNHPHPAVHPYAQESVEIDAAPLF